jgi:hypothetical protein
MILARNRSALKIKGKREVAIFDGRKLSQKGVRVSKGILLSIFNFEFWQKLVNSSQVKKYSLG